MDMSLVELAPLSYVAIALGLFMAWAIGANDFSNSAGPAVGARVFDPRAAIFIVMLFELFGAIFYGAHVTETLSRNLIDVSIGTTQPLLVAYGMLASLLAAAIWLAVASARGWPVSTTHAIVGAMVGFALTGIGFDAVYWGGIGLILGSWAVSPLVAGALAYLVMKSIEVLILEARDPVTRARRWVPLYVFVTGALICLVTFSRGMLPLGIELDDSHALLLSLLFGGGMAFIGILVVSGRSVKDVEHAFAPITIFSVCSMAFAHGSNDVANSVGPMSLIIELLNSDAVPGQSLGPPFWVFLLGGIGIALGVVTFGLRVVTTIGQRITRLTPSRAFAVALASTATVVVASGLGLPVSTTHTLVGAVLGVGLVSGSHSIDIPVIRTIVNAWLVTLPLTGVLAAALFLLLRAMIGS